MGLFFSWGAGGNRFGAQSCIVGVTDLAFT